MAAILLIHSSGASARLWRPVSELLAERHDVHAPDLPGHGGQPGPFTAERAVAVVRAAMPPEPVHLVGLSVGATVAALACLDAPTGSRRSCCPAASPTRRRCWPCSASR